MANITIGNAATNRGGIVGTGATYVDYNSPAGASGTVNVVQFFVYDTLYDAVVAIYQDMTSNNFKVKDTETIGTVTGGGTNTFTGLDLSVESGEYIGLYFSAGYLDTDDEGSTYSAVGSKTEVGTTYALSWSSDTISLFGRTSAAPTVTTQAASSVTSTTATGNGNITDPGGIAPTRRGIQWDIHTHSGGAYANDIYETGTYGTGAFTISLTSLPAGTTIYARAYATNVDGTGYGDEVTFTTLAAIAPIMNHYRRLRGN